MISSTIQASKLSRVKSFFQSKAPSCVHEPSGKLKHRFVTPSYGVKAGGDDSSDVSDRSLTGHYLQMYDWDACFFSQAAAKMNIHGLQSDVVANFLSLKDALGHVPRTVSPQRIWDSGDQCKPFLCQTLAQQVRTEGKENPQFENLLDGLESYLQYFEKKRKKEHGLYCWRNVLESGVDDNLALLSPREAAKDEDDSVNQFPDGRLLAVDLSGYLVAEFRAFAELCKLSGKASVAQKYDRMSAELAEAIDAYCWNEKIGMYCNLDPRDGSQMVLRAWTGLVPVLLGLVKPERIEQVIQTNVISEEQFLRAAGMASVAASEPLYNNAKRGLYGRAIVSNWQGPVWVLNTGLAVRCLLREGFQKEAEELAKRMINTLDADIEKNGTLHENYHADTGQPLWAPQFMSWNILALELIEILE